MYGGSLEVIDKDSELFKRVVVIEVQSGGNHLPYRCEEMWATQKLVAEDQLSTV